MGNGSKSNSLKISQIVCLFFNLFLMVASKMFLFAEEDMIAEDRITYVIAGRPVCESEIGKGSDALRRSHLKSIKLFILSEMSWLNNSCWGQYEKKASHMLVRSQLKSLEKDLNLKETHFAHNKQLMRRFKLLLKKKISEQIFIEIFYERLQSEVPYGSPLETKHWLDINNKKKTEVDLIMLKKVQLYLEEQLESEELIFIAHLLKSYMQYAEDIPIAEITAIIKKKLKRELVLTVEPYKNCTAEYLLPLQIFLESKDAKKFVGKNYTQGSVSMPYQETTGLDAHTVTFLCITKTARKTIKNPKLLYQIALACSIQNWKQKNIDQQLDKIKNLTVVYPVD